MDISLLQKTLDFTSTGVIPSGKDRDEIAQQLNHIQERYDLAQTAMGIFHMGRISNLAQKVQKVEEGFFNEDGDLVVADPSLRLDIYRELSKQLHLSSKFVDDKAAKPTISSPERLDRVTSNPDVEDEKVKRLPPAARRRVNAFLSRLGIGRISQQEDQDPAQVQEAEQEPT